MANNMDKDIITPIGTLEWNVGTIYDFPAHLESMRPTVEEDKEHNTRYTGQCELPSLHLGASEEDRKKEFTQTMMYVITYVIHIMEKDGIEGLVHITELGSDYYHYDPVKYRLTGDRSGQVFRLGDIVSVKVMRASLDDARIDFRLVGDHAKGTHAGAATDKRKGSAKSMRRPKRRR